MQDIATIVTGYDAHLTITLTKDDATFAIDPLATVKAALVSTDRLTTILPFVTSSYSEAGADWAKSLIIVNFPDTETINISDFGDALLEIQVDDQIKLPWYIDADVIEGRIA